MKKNSKSVSVVSPVYNNQNTITFLSSKILSLLKKKTSNYELLLIDDKSTDDSPLILKSLEKNKHIRALYHNSNKGTAYTYKELYSQAKGERVILFSFDGEWNPENIAALIDASDKADIVVGKRKKKAYSLGRSVVSWSYNALTKLLFGVETFDAGSIKLVSKNIIESVPIISTGVFDEAERIIRAQKMGYTVTSIPVDHFSSEKKRKGVLFRLPLIAQAVIDMLRVFIDLFFFSPTASPASPASSSGRSSGKSGRKSR